VTPEIHFKPDPSIAESIRMSKLIDDLNDLNKEKPSEDA